MSLPLPKFPLLRAGDLKLSREETPPGADDNPPF
jgi:hypothetical protein